MHYADFLNAVIDDGQDEVRRTYLRPDQSHKREGALKGFDECRGKLPEALAELLLDANGAVQVAYRKQADDYWFWVYRRGQIEWVLNVVSAAAYMNGGVVVGTPTARGLSKAVEVLGGEPFIGVR